MFSKVFVFALLLAIAAAFSPATFKAARTSSALNGFKINDDPTKKNADGRCLQKDVDPKGRCPGDTGYKPPVGNG